jgi:serine protease AprX
MLVAPSAALADATLSTSLASAAAENPNQVFDVIVQGEQGKSSSDVANAITAEVGPRAAPGRGMRRTFSSIVGASASLTGRQILALADANGILAVSEDASVRLSDFSSDQLWPEASGVSQVWSQLTPNVKAPTIAILDSGIQNGRRDFGSNRLLAQVNLCSLPHNSAGDGRGHGTFVASVAAGSASHYAGAAPTARLVSVDVVDDLGMGLASDVIAGADWVLKNKTKYNIRVANLSLTGSTPSTFRFDPLNKAVEKLWFSGITVVTAAGNYGDLTRGVLYSPANDPFVITVGALDLAGTAGTADDFPAPWSSYGSTLDGFLKPELTAPGRMIVGAVPPRSTLHAERPDRVVAPGYMAMSGTSFSAAIVSGIAADLLALHPRWTPDQVKGALMQTAKPITHGPPFAGGIGEVAARAAARVTSLANPNLGLNRFLIPDPAGSTVPVFDEATWTTVAKANPAWNAATWTTASWTTATWTTASWTTASWTTATWTTATWTTATWTTATWTTATWTTSSNLD